MRTATTTSVLNVDYTYDGSVPSLTSISPPTGATGTFQFFFFSFFFFFFFFFFFLVRLLPLSLHPPNTFSYPASHSRAPIALKGVSTQPSITFTFSGPPYLDIDSGFSVTTTPNPGGWYVNSAWGGGQSTLTFTYPGYVLQENTEYTISGFSHTEYCVVTNFVTTFTTTGPATTTTTTTTAVRDGWFVAWARPVPLSCGCVCECEGVSE